MSATQGQPSAGQDHYCFVIHDSIPYCYDINAIMALPAGFRYRNRFDKNWVEPNLWSAISTMIDKRVLIILRDQARNLLIPARWATIRLAERIGRVYYFEYSLGELIQYPEDEAARTSQIDQITGAFRNFHNWLPGSAGQPLGPTQPSVFRSAAGNALATASDNHPSEWGNTVSALTTAQIFQNTEFLKVLGLRELSGREAPVVEESFVIKPNTVYQLRVLQTIPVPDATGLHPHDIEVVTFNDHFIQLRPKQRAVGKYDMLNFVLKTKRLPPQERSAIEIPHVPHHLQGVFAPSALYMPVMVLSRSPVVVALWAALAVGCLIAMFNPSLSPGDADTVRNIATVVFVLIVSGWRQTLDSIFPSLPWGGSKA